MSKYNLCKNLRLAFLCLFLMPIPPLSAQTRSVPDGYQPDILGPEFIAKTILMPDDYEGPVITTLIRPSVQPDTGLALLYVHGYNDYFFQEEMARFFTQNGFRFYAIDLRKYGRSKLPDQYPFMVLDLKEYFADIDSAVAQMQREGCRNIGLMAHSTGGLITSLYAEQNKDRLPFFAMVLNSPFLDMNFSGFTKKIVIPIVSGIGRTSPKMKINGGLSTAYAESLLSHHHGEWQFDTAWKYPVAPKLTASWLRAIHLGHKTLQKGLDIPCPVLVAHSHQSVYGKKWKPDHQQGDAVLNVRDIEKYGRTLGKKASTLTIENGLHDLALSDRPVRNRFYRASLDFFRQSLPQTMSETETSPAATPRP